MKGSGKDRHFGNTDYFSDSPTVDMGAVNSDSSGEVPYIKGGRALCF